MRAPKCAASDSRHSKAISHMTRVRANAFPTTYAIHLQMVRISARDKKKLRKKLTAHAHRSASPMQFSAQLHTRTHTHTYRGRHAMMISCVRRISHARWHIIRVAQRKAMSCDKAHPKIIAGAMPRVCVCVCDRPCPISLSPRPVSCGRHSQTFVSPVKVETCVRLAHTHTSHCDADIVGSV